MESEEDFGFHDYDSAMENGDILVLSDFHILPRAGGWEDQDEKTAQDLLTYLRGLAWARSLKGADNGRTEDLDIEGDKTAAGFSSKNGIEAFL